MEPVIDVILNRSLIYENQNVEENFDTKLWIQFLGNLGFTK